MIARGSHWKQLGKARWKSHLYLKSCHPHLQVPSLNSAELKPLINKERSPKQMTLLFIQESLCHWITFYMRLYHYRIHPTYSGKTQSPPTLDLRWTKSYAWLPTDLVLFSYYEFWYNWKGCQKTWSFKWDSIVVTVCFLIADWWDANITVTLHTVTTSKVGCNPSSYQCKLLLYSSPGNLLTPDVLGAVPALAPTTHFS